MRMEPAEEHVPIESWNSRFLTVMEKLRKSRHSEEVSLAYREKVIKDLLHLNEDFIHAAKVYGKIIISEVFLPDSAKTIRPKSLGGIAGGDKYLVQDILFKFAVDGHGLYGGDNLRAAKVAGHELKGLLSYMGCDLPDVNFPLMALLDYRGFRLVAMSKLPLGDDTLIYGSKDAGKTVHVDEELFNRRMRYCGKKLHLAKHLSGGKKIWAAADIEGHKGTDGRYYLLDFSRTFPPVKPDPNFPNGHLYQLFRREFVLSHKIPLCSDAYSGFVMGDPNARQFFQDIDEATDMLITKTIPKAGKTLMALLMRICKRNILHELDVSQKIHQYAINLRYLGLVYQHLRASIDASALMRDESTGLSAADLSDDANSNWKQDLQERALPLFVIEAVARVAKNTLRRKLQEKMRELKVPMEVPYRRIVVNFMNRIFSSTNKSQQWWENVGNQLTKSFHFDPKCLPKTGLKLAKMVFFPQRETDRAQGLVFSGRWCLFQRLTQMTGMIFSSDAKRRFKGLGRWNALEPIDIVDLKNIGERVKFMDVVDIAEASFFEVKGLQAEKRGLADSEDLYTKALKKFEKALMSSPNNPETLLSCARVATKVLEIKSKRLNLAPELTDRALCEQTSVWFSQTTSANTHHKSDPRYYLPYAHFLTMTGANNKAEEKYLEGLETGSYNLRVLLAYGNFLISTGREEQGKVVLALAGDQRNSSFPSGATRGEVSESERVSIRVFLPDGTFKTVATGPSTTASELRVLVIKAMIEHTHKYFQCTEQQLRQLAGYYEMFGMHEVNKSQQIDRLLPDDERPWITILQRPGNQSAIHLRANTLRTIDTLVQGVPQGTLPILSDTNTFLLRMRVAYGLLNPEPEQDLRELFAEIDLTDAYREIRQAIADAFSLRVGIRAALKRPRSHHKLSWTLGHVCEAFRLLLLPLNVCCKECQCESLSYSDSLSYPWDANNIGSDRKRGDMLVSVDAPTYYSYFSNWAQTELKTLFFPVIQGTKVAKDTARQAHDRASIFVARMLKIYSHLIFRHWNFVQSFLLSDLVSLSYMHLYWVCLDFGFYEPKKSPDLFTNPRANTWAEEQQQHLSDAKALEQK